MAVSTSPEVLIVEDLKEQRLTARWVAAALRNSGIGVRLVDAEVDLVAALESCQGGPVLVVFSVLFSDRLEEYLRAMSACRSAGARAHFTMIGPLPALASAELLSASAALDSVVCGEPENIVVELARHISDPAAWARIPGLVSRTSVPPSLPPPATNDLDTLPTPWRMDGLASFHGYPFATMESSRGCFHSCSFCLPAAFYRRLHLPQRRRDPARVAAELEELYRQGVRLVLFDDEQFLPLPSERSEYIARLAEEIRARDLAMAFTVKCRADDVDATLFTTLKTLGLVRTFVGIESGCQETLDLYGKGTRVQQNVAALKTLKGLGIVADFRSLLLHPWTTLETLETEIAFFESIGSLLATALDFRTLEVYSGTPIAKRLENEGRLETGSWQISYSLPDARAELVRRCAHLLFISSGEYRRWLGSLSQAWYRVLLDQRLNPAPGDAGRARRLQELVQGMNGRVLETWREILAFVRSGPIQDVPEVNRRSADWGLHIHGLAREYSTRVLQA